MRINEVFAAAPDNKLKKLRAVITPENIAQHYDLVMNALALKMPATDIDALVASLTDSDPDPEDEEFQLKMAAKALKSLHAEVVKKGGDVFVMGSLPPVDEDPPSGWAFTFNFKLYRHKGLWEAWHHKVGYRIGSSSKRFEKISDAIEYVKKQGARHEKLRIEMANRKEK